MEGLDIADSDGSERLSVTFTDDTGVAESLGDKGRMRGFRRLALMSGMVSPIDGENALFRLGTPGFCPQVDWLPGGVTFVGELVSAS